MDSKKITPKIRYQKKHTTQLRVELYDTTDADIIARLDKMGPKSTYIKRLIREDIEKENPWGDR